MSCQLSDRVQSIKPSPTLAVTARASELRAAGRDVIGLGAGEPDFDTPEHIREAAIQAIRDGFTHYTAVDGIAELKDAIIDKFRRDNQIDYRAPQILVSSGAKQSVYNLCQALLNDGDEVVIPAPCWVSYPDIATLAGAKPVIVDTGAEQRYKMSAEQLENALTPATRLVILNSPCNPTGTAYTRDELRALGDVLGARPDVIVATDDMYEHIYWADEPFCSLLTACPELFEQTVTINGVSKCYAMTGWRIGYAGGPEKLIKAMKKIQGQSTSNPSSISQKAAVAALNGDHACVADMTTEFRKRHDFVVAALNNIPGVSCLQGDGTFYAFADVREVIARIDWMKSDSQLAEYLIDEAGVAVVPGSAFLAEGYFRLSFASSMPVLEDALGRIAGALKA